MGTSTRAEGSACKVWPLAFGGGGPLGPSQLTFGGGAQIHGTQHTDTHTAAAEGAQPLSPGTLFSPPSRQRRDVAARRRRAAVKHRRRPAHPRARLPSSQANPTRLFPHQHCAIINVKASPRLSADRCRPASPPPTARLDDRIPRVPRRGATNQPRPSSVCLCDHRSTARRLLAATLVAHTRSQTLSESPAEGR